MRAGGVALFRIVAEVQRFPALAATMCTQRFIDTGALFQALGGGWWNRNDVADNAPSTTRGSP